MDTSWVGSQLRAERAAAGMTQEQLAASSGLSVQTVQRIEVGKRSGRIDSLVAMLSALGVPPSRFFTRAEERHDAPQQLSAARDR